MLQHHAPTFGERLRDLRKEKNLLQSEFGEIFELSPSAIGSYERNLREPQYQHLVAFADYFKVSVDYLLCRTDERLTVADYTARDKYQFTELLRKHAVYFGDTLILESDKDRITDIAFALLYK